VASRQGPTARSTWHNDALGTSDTTLGRRHDGFCTDLPESTSSENTGILVIGDRLTKMAIYLPCRKDVDSPELARFFFEHVICKHARPNGNGKSNPDNRLRINLVSINKTHNQCRVWRLLSTKSTFAWIYESMETWNWRNYTNLKASRAAAMIKISTSRNYAS
jgi:hypothetical protein